MGKTPFPRGPPVNDLADLHLHTYRHSALSADNARRPDVDSSRCRAVVLERRSTIVMILPAGEGKTILAQRVLSRLSLAVLRSWT